MSEPLADELGGDEEVAPLTRERIAEIEPNWKRLYDEDIERGGGNWVAPLVIQLINTIHAREDELEQAQIELSGYRQLHELSAANGSVQQEAR